jgi:hypothetical protein
MLAGVTLLAAVYASPGYHENDHNYVSTGNHMGG